MSDIRRCSISDFMVIMSEKKIQQFIIFSDNYPSDNLE